MFSSCAMKLNGVYIEDLIDGYTTLSVEGRDALEMTEETEDVGVRPGTLFKRKKYSARTLVINFAIEGDDTTEIRTKGRELQYTLNTGNEECEIIFDDENDVFYKGIPIGGVSFSVAPMHGTGNAIGTGSFNILCADPFKYSVEEFEVESDGEIYIDTEEGIDADMMDEFVIDYNGTYPAYPTFIANMYNGGPYNKRTGWYFNQSGMGLKRSTKDRIETMGGCGFLAFIKSNPSGDAKVLQFGDPDFERFTELSTSKRLINEKYGLSTSWDKHSSKWDIYSNFNSVGFDIGTRKTKLNLFNSEERSFAPSVISSVIQDKTPLTDWLYDKTLKKYVFLLHEKFTDSVKVTEKNVTKTYNYISFNRIFITSMTRTSASNLKITLTVTATVLRKIEGKNARSISFGVTFDGGNNWKEIVLFKNKKTIKKGAKSTKQVTINVALGSNAAEVYSIPASAIKVRTTASEGSVGVTKASTCRKILFNTYKYHNDSGWYLTCDGYGTDEYDGFHGPVMYRQIPEDPLSDECRHWQLKVKPLFGIGNVTGSNIANKRRKGAIFIAVVDEEDNLLGSFAIVKTSNNGTKAKIYRGYARGYVEVGEVDVTGNGFDSEIVIKFRDNEIDFKFSSKLDPEPIYLPFDMRGSLSPRADKIIVGFFQYKTEPPMFKNGIRSLTFGKWRTNSAGEEIFEVENEAPFNGGDTLMADTSTCSVTINGRESAELGALGNDWDKMTIDRGINIFGAYASNFYTTEEIMSGKANHLMRQCSKDDPYRPLYIRCAAWRFTPCYDENTNTFAEFDPDNLYIKASDPNNYYRHDDETGEKYDKIDNIRDYETYLSYPYEYFYNLSEVVAPYDSDEKYYYITEILREPINDMEYDDSYRNYIESVKLSSSVHNESYYNANARYLYRRSTNPFDTYYSAYAEFELDSIMEEYRTVYNENATTYKNVPEYNNTKRYKLNEKVQLDGHVYRCIRYGCGSTSNPKSSSIFTLVSVRYINKQLIKNVVSFIDNRYVNKNSWTKNEICTHKSVPYICNVSFNKKNVTIPEGESIVPGVGKYSRYWRKLNTNKLSDATTIYLSKKTNIKWNNEKIYKNNDLVSYNDQLYLCKGLDFCAYINPTNTTFWKYIGTSTEFRDQGETEYYRRIDELYAVFNNLESLSYFDDLETYRDINGVLYCNCGDLYDLSKGTRGTYVITKYYYNSPDLLFKEAYPSPRRYNKSPESYYILDVEKPQFKIKYREVFI